MKVLSERATLDDLAEVIGECGIGGPAAITGDHAAELRLILTDQDSESTGWRSERNVEALAWQVRWTWESRTRGRRPQVATVFQVIEGGRAGGEGWAYVRQYVAQGAFTPEEAELTAKLIAAGSLPVAVAEGEL